MVQKHSFVQHQKSIDVAKYSVENEEADWVLKKGLREFGYDEPVVHEWRVWLFECGAVSLGEEVADGGDDWAVEEGDHAGDVPGELFFSEIGVLDFLDYWRDWAFGFEE